MIATADRTCGELTMSTQKRQGIKALGRRTGDNVVRHSPPLTLKDHHSLRYVLDSARMDLTNIGHPISITSRFDLSRLGTSASCRDSEFNAWCIRM